MVTPDMGHELPYRLERGGRCPPVIFVSDTEDLSVAVRELQNGAHDFLQKPIDANLLIGAIDNDVRQPFAVGAVLVGSDASRLAHLWTTNRFVS